MIGGLGGFTVEMPLRVSDLSPAGHLGNVGSMRLLDEARFAFLGTVLAGGDRYSGGLLEVLGNEAALVVARHTVDYRHEVWFRGQSVRVELAVPYLGRTSIRLSGSIYDAGATEPATVCESVGVLVSRADRRPWPITDAVRTALAAWPGRPQPDRSPVHLSS